MSRQYPGASDPSSAKPWAWTAAPVATSAGIRSPPRSRGGALSIQRGVFTLIGLRSTEILDAYSLDPDSAHLGTGATIVFVASGIWMAREHLGEVFAKALRKAPEVDDTGEMISCRQAVFGLLGSLLLVAVGLCMTGLPPLGGADVHVCGAVVFLSLTRCPVCGGPMRIIAALTHPHSIRTDLDGVGRPSRAPPVAAARPDPQQEFDCAA